MTAHRFVAEAKTQEIQSNDSVEALSERIPNLMGQKQILRTQNTKTIIMLLRMRCKHLVPIIAGRGESMEENHNI